MGKPRRIHPTPAQVSPALPVAVAALAVALSPEEKDVLFYLLSVASGQPTNLRKSSEHSPDLGCGCFSCYKVFWERWDSSPNRQVIHEIIEKVEASEEGKSRRKSRRMRGKDRKKSVESNEEEIKEEGLVGDANHDPDDCNVSHDDHDDGCSVHDSCSDGGNNKNSVVGRFVRFIGEKLLWAN
ncbi:hypothetical protein LUZ62_036851 [Rhynchospora pubera]|uniref:Uncharacterized protein n=1 Tax=Rhynchospora pubera TaxID=906938 RepID=A0AAV8APR8_9POAL|nr:hypothetical protein LUZ62_006003 [Rhynchospora pubera]KAJ4778729.1 hypothetical protein LUZ62_062986 [Rhynchospora pubera]KAJ4785605.1 hypothetical protein LUZ62_036851 [Rhynchospora pubera]